MANHHSQESIDLHHRQVNAGKERRQRRLGERLGAYLIRRAEYYRDYWVVVGISVFCFAYGMIAIAVYLGKIL